MRVGAATPLHFLFLLKTQNPSGIQKECWRVFPRHSARASRSVVSLLAGRSIGGVAARPEQTKAP
jgi:hypothetical protein